MDTGKKHPLQATDYVAEWIALHRHEIDGVELQFIREDQHGRKLCAEFETPTYFLQFLAWDHACCLDLLALHKERGSADFIAAGECDGTGGLGDRLDTFLQWIKDHSS